MVESSEIEPTIKNIENGGDVSEELNNTDQSQPVSTDESLSKPGQTEVNQGISLIKEMMANGVHYGRAKRFTHPSIKPFLQSYQRGNIETFDLKKTIGALNQMVALLVEAIKTGKTILFVGTQPAAQESVKKFAQKLRQPYIIHKWVGGFLTNFETIRSRLIYFKELLVKEESGEIANYPIKDAQRMRRELEKMKRLYTGVIDITEVPDYVFIVNLDFRGHRTAVRECVAKQIPILALAGSDNNVTNVKLFIPANDKAPRSINFILKKLLERIKDSGLPLETDQNKLEMTIKENEIITDEEKNDKPAIQQNFSQDKIESVSLEASNGDEAEEKSLTDAENNVSDSNFTETEEVVN